VSVARLFNIRVCMRDAAPSLGVLPPLPSGRVCTFMLMQGSYGHGKPGRVMDF